MASNKHWPSMFKSKPHQWNDVPSTGTGRSLSSVCEEPRSNNPEPKPRWNPRPEQLRILEAIFHSGIVNPPRDEIRRIRNQLLEYGQVGDANVFYWFQNRKSRSKSKKNTHKFSHFSHTSQPPMMMRRSPLSTSSSSSERSSHNSADKTLSLSSFNVNSPTASVNQPFLTPRGEFLAAPFSFPATAPPPPPPNPSPATFGSQEFCFSNPPPTNVNAAVPNSTNLFLSDLMLQNHAPNKKAMDDDVGANNKVLNPFASFDLNPVPSTTHALTTYDHLQGLAEAPPMKSTVFINDMGFEVANTGFNVREAFGDDAMLLYPSGQPVLTNEWGLTLYPLQDGACYYLIRMIPNASNNNETNFHNLI